ncbi:MAG: hypothetical protein WDN01_20335 [Rhizomicrobium sp.]
MFAAWFAAGPARAADPAPANPPSSEDERLKLFQSVFGGKPPDAAPRRTLSVPLFLDGVAIAQIQAKGLSDGSAFRIESHSLVAALTPLLEADQLARLAAHADTDGFLGLDDLKTEGLAARFDPGDLVLILDLPVKLRRVQAVNIGPGPPVIGSNGLAPAADVSSYLNMRGSLDYVSADSHATSGLQATVALDGAVNVLGSVLEGSLLYSGSAPQPFQRGDLRLVHDDPDRALRYSAGDLTYGVAGFQSFVPMAGFSLARNFSLQPYFITQPTGSQDFVLDQASQVQVFINGIQSRVLTLPAGRYNLNNFAFAEGPNDVVLRATDGVGRVSTFSSPFFFSSNLLGAGVQEFSYNVGLPSAIGTAGYIYDAGLPSVSGFHRIGLSDTLTVGGNFQGSVLQQQLGGEIGYASDYGTVHMDAAASHLRGAGFDGALRLSYSLLDSRPEGFGGSLLAQATYTGANFSRLGTVTPFNLAALDLGLRYTQPILGDVYASFGASYRVGRNGAGNGHDLSLSFQHSFLRGLIANLRLEQSVDRGSRSSSGALLAVTWQIGDGHSTLQSTYDTARDTLQASYQYSPSNFVGEPGGALNVVKAGNQEQVTGSVYYNANRFETSLSHDVLFPSPDSDQGTVQRTSFRFGSSLVFADGHFGVGRPVDDSFAIVAPTPSYADQKIILDSSGINGRYDARTDWLGPAVLPNLTAYQIRPLAVTVPDLPVGYQLGQDTYQLNPNYRSGTVVVVGNDATVVLDGVLTDASGAPLALLAGEIVPLDKTGAAAGEFFTNRQGRFRIEGIGPGSFELRLVRSPHVVARITIPPGTTGVYVVGDVTLAVQIEAAR